LNGAAGVNELYAPIFERAILETWDNKFGGTYKLADALVEIVVDYNTSTIQLARLESGGQDWLIVQDDSDPARRTDLISYLWSSGDDLAYRYYMCIR